MKLRETRDKRKYEKKIEMPLFWKASGSIWLGSKGSVL